MKHIKLSFLHPPRDLECALEDTILTTLLAQQVPIRHACDNGVCGICLTRLLTGEIDYGTKTPRGLTTKEQAEGYFLPCIATCQTDISIAQPKVKLR
ncbi:2Fe-2S iron-sulfur cluster-binding protein [Marinomonas sp. TW1]|uniref:2Fe-2S iron-sulfur cluster-binding protein n=1 Tax=Marinomonas sp. TW1 TaxID=1561203 RepID=UPI001E2C2DFB|nr:2Fe-2S iron-sulfur cluster-binding protein [Marinomonas sp. TW1]